MGSPDVNSKKRRRSFARRKMTLWFIRLALRLGGERRAVAAVAGGILCVVPALILTLMPMLSLLPNGHRRALRARNAARAETWYEKQTRILSILKTQHEAVTTLLREDGLSEEEYECKRWVYDDKSANQCSFSSSPSKWWASQWESKEYGCDEYLPVSPGYCEFQSRATGEIKRIAQKPCQRDLLPGELAQPPYFTCDMALAFANYKYNATHFQPESPLPFPQKQQSRDSNDLVDKTKADDSLASANHEPKRGIIIEAYDAALPGVYTILKLLREEYNCSLPVELWSRVDEIRTDNKVVKKILTTFPGSWLTLRVIPKDAIFQPYMSKPYSIAYSNFDEVLFVDSDNFPLRDPSNLFDMPDYLETGAVFWKDYWSPQRNEFYIRQDSLLWELLGIDTTTQPYIMHQMEMESGMMLVNRHKSQEALKTLLFFCETFQHWFEPLGLVLGDKDLFRLAWYLVDQPFHYIKHPPSMVGLAENSWWFRYWYQYRICGLSMLQYDPDGIPLFVHRNELKLTEPFVGLSQIWERGANFVGTADVDAPSDNIQYQVTGTFASHHLLGRMCYHPAPSARGYFEEEDYTERMDNGNPKPVRALEDKILLYAGEAAALLEIGGA